MQLTMNVEGHEQLVRNIGFLSNDIDDLTTPMSKTGDFFISEIKKNFQSKGSHFGQRGHPAKRIMLGRLCVNLARWLTDLRMNLANLV